MAWPIVLGTMSWTLMHFVDMAMVGQLGTAPLAAVGAGGLWIYTVASFVIGVSTCVGTFVSQSIGRGEPSDCARYTWQGVYFSVASCVFAFVLWPLSEPIFSSMSHGAEVTRLEVEYFQVRLVGFAFIAWQGALAGFFQGINKPRIPMVVAVISVVLNIVLDYAFIFGKFGVPRMEVAGAAWATVVALGVQVALLQLIMVSGSINAEFGSRAAYRFDKEKMRELLQVGIPSGLSMVLNVTNWAIFTGYIVGRFGETALAAHNAAVTLMHLSFMPAIALNNAIAPIVGQWIGKGLPDRAEGRTYTAMRLAVVYMLFMGTLFAFSGPYLLRIFTLDQEVIDMGWRLLICAAIFQGFDAVTITLSGALRGAGDTRWMAWTTALCAYCFFLPTALALAFPLHLGALGAWYGATAYIILLSGLSYWRFQGGRWRRIKIFHHGAKAAADPGL